MKCSLQLKSRVQTTVPLARGPGADRVLLKLYEGWNHILVKISRSSGPKGFYFEITDPNGRNIPELKYATDRM